MIKSKLLTAASVLTFLSAPGHVLAQDSTSSPDTLCAHGTAGQCNGELGQSTVSPEPPLPPRTVALPAASGKNVFITQIGEENHATVRQESAIGHADVKQQGDHNRADVTQHGASLAYADVLQSGSSNNAAATQDGTAANVLYVKQNGSGNSIEGGQYNAGDVYNAARMTQQGNGNSMTLSQSGADNQAVLAQVGDNNNLTASQSGEGNRLDWTQNGSNLAAPVIFQTGGSIMRVTQTGG